MPEIEVKTGDWLGLFVKALSLSLDPTGREDGLAGNESGILGPLMFWFFDSNPDKLAKINAEVLSLIGHSDPNKFQIGHNAGQFAYGMLTSGHILSYVLRMGRYNAKIASVESAVRILEHRYTQEGSPSGTTSIKVAWSKYKNVSPFMVGLMLASIKSESLIRQIPSIISNTEKLGRDVEVDKKGMKDYLGLLMDGSPLIEKYCSEVIPHAAAFAEKYRIAGEKHFASGQEARNKPLLDPEKTWRVPQGFELLEVELGLDRLSGEEFEAATVK